MKEYYYISVFGEIESGVCEFPESEEERLLYRAGNIFSTRAEALRALARIKKAICE